jgi:hypothetical protein
MLKESLKGTLLILKRSKDQCSIKLQGPRLKDQSIIREIREIRGQAKRSSSPCTSVISVAESIRGIRRG